MATTRKTPIRSCCVCGEKQGKASLVRIVRTPEGVVKLDVSGKEAGRGAYICVSKSCFDKAKKQRKLDKALRLTLDNDDYDRLEQDFGLFLSEAQNKVSSGEGTVD